MGKKSAPRPPDPVQTAGAQTGMNIGTAIAQQSLNNVNQVTPYGNLSYRQTGSLDWTDPLTDQVYQLPQFTATQTLSPDQQRLHNAQMSAGTNTARLAADQTRRLGSILGRPINFDRAPDVRAPNMDEVGDGPYMQTQIGGAGGIRRRIADAGGIARGFANAGGVMRNIADAGDLQRGVAGAGRIQGNVPGAGALTRQIGPAGQIQGQFGQAGAITRNYGGQDGYEESRGRVEQALMSRMNPMLDQERSRLSSQLANQGIKQGTEAYDRAMANYGQRANDAQMQAILAGGQEQSRLAGLDQARAQFQNSAQAQAYQQLLGRGEFANAAQAQRFGQAAERADFANQSQAQQFGQNLAAGEFANAAQGQRYAQNANDMQMRNAAQAQQFGQNQARTEANNAAQQQAYNQLLGRRQFANQAQQQQFAQNAARSQFGNQAQQQAFDQNTTRATFGNDARQQGFANQMAAAGFNNQAAQQQFQNQRGMRSDYLNEQYAARNQPINEIAALLGTGQVQNPNFINQQNPAIANTDYAGLVNQNYNQRLQAWQQQQEQRQSMMGGLFGLGAAGISAFPWG